MLFDMKQIKVRFGILSIQVFFLPKCTLLLSEMPLQKFSRLLPSLFEDFFSALFEVSDFDRLSGIDNMCALGFMHR